LSAAGYSNITISCFFADPFDLDTGGFMDVITPDKLFLDAVSLSSLDNQFVPDDLLLSMVKKEQDYNSKEIREQRARLGRIELKRSLIYSKQVVINRAYFVNTSYLFENYNSVEKALDFAKLMESKAVIPFVTGDNLLDKTDFEKHPDGAAALELLLHQSEHTDMVTLNPGLGQADPLQRMGAHFTDLIAGLDKLKSEGIRLLLSQLNAHILQDPARTSEFILQFERHLKELAALAQTKRSSNPPQAISRNEIYQEFFCIPDPVKNESVANGRFSKKLEEDPTLILVKRLVDMAYNFNLPDHLGCFSLTAPGMAGRTPMDLIRVATDISAPTHSVAVGIDKEKEKMIEAVAQINARYVNMSMEVRLPNLEKFTIGDIHTIRNDPKDNSTWKSYINIKEKLLKVNKADDLPGAFDEYVARHREMHKALFLMRTTSFLPERVAQIIPYIDCPLLRLASVFASLANLDTVSNFAEFLEALPKEAAIEFGMSLINEKRAELQSSMTFRSIHRLQVHTRDELFRLGRELHKIEAGARKHDNREVEQSKP
jgi:hypothetical protein